MRAFLPISLALIASLSSAMASAEPSATPQLPPSATPPVAAATPPAAATSEAVATPSADTAEQAAPVAPTPATPEVSQPSIFFTPLQMKLLHDALQAFEKNKKSPTSSGELTVITEEGKAPPPAEPAAYPFFYLSSIVYHSPKDWAVWVSGYKITPTKNTTDLTVVSVSAERASFTWSPKFADILVSRQQSHLLAPTDKVKHKLTKPSTCMLDEKTGTVSFTLRPNQTFVPGYMHTFEGYVESPSMPSLAPSTETKEPGNAPADAAAATPSQPSPQPDATLVDTRPVNPLDAATAGESRKAIDEQLKRQDNTAKQEAPAVATPAATTGSTPALPPTASASSSKKE